MNFGYCVLQWIQQSGQTLAGISDEIGYSRTMLSQALNHNRISSRMAARLHQHYRLRVLPKDRPPWQIDAADNEPPHGQRGILRHTLFSC